MQIGPYLITQKVFVDKLPLNQGYSKEQIESKEIVYTIFKKHITPDISQEKSMYVLCTELFGLHACLQWIYNDTYCSR